MGNLLAVFGCSDLFLTDAEILAHYTIAGKFRLCSSSKKMYTALKSLIIRSAKAIDRLFSSFLWRTSSLSPFLCLVAPSHYPPSL